MYSNFGLRDLELIGTSEFERSRKCRVSIVPTNVIMNMWCILGIFI